MKNIPTKKIGSTFHLYIYICIYVSPTTYSFGSTFHHSSLVHPFRSAFWRWFVDGIDWINLLKDGWGALFGWLDRIGPPEEPRAGGKGGEGKKEERWLPFEMLVDAGGCGDGVLGGSSQDL